MNSTSNNTEGREMVTFYEYIIITFFATQLIYSLMANPHPPCPLYQKFIQFNTQ